MTDVYVIEEGDPRGFSTTPYAYREFLKQENLGVFIYEILSTIDVLGSTSEAEAVGEEIRISILETPLPRPLIEAVVAEFLKFDSTTLFEVSSLGVTNVPLEVRGIANVITAIHEVFASLWSDKAILYREQQGFEHETAIISAIIKENQ